jgi:peptidoglycan/LPS O-acetylase OafA/YrhL
MPAAGTIRVRGHLPGLDGVRGLAILMVMSLHFVGDAPAHTALQRVVVKFAGLGLLGVDLFFVLSGFLITGILVDAKGEPHFFRNFYARRTLRIFPLYYFVLAVLFLLLPAVVTPSPLLEVARSHQLWAWTYTTNFYLAAKASWASLTYVSHFWSLAVEEHFYLLWPLLVFTFRRPVLERICLGIIAGGLLLRLLLVSLGMSELSVSVLTPCRIDTLAVGALLSLLVRREGGAEALVGRAARAALGLAVTIVVVSAFGALTHQALGVLHQIRGTLYALLFGSITLLALRSASEPFGWILQTAPLRFFGKYSYGLYVYHGLLTWYLIDVGASERIEAWVGGRPWLAMAVHAALGVGVSLAVAVTSYELLERRFLQLKRRFAPDGQVEALAVPAMPSPPPGG